MKRHDYTSSEFVAACTTGWNPYRKNTGRISSRDTSSPGWHGTSSFPEALDLYCNGWPEGLSKVAELRAKIMDVVATRFKKTELSYEVFGGYPDVGAFLSGDPENMIHKHDVDVVSERCSANKVLSIVINGAVSCDADNKAVAMVRGSIACAISDILETLGYRCEIFTAFGVGRCQTPDNDPNQELYIKLKSPSEPLDLERIAFAMCHSSMYRRMVFSVWENLGIDRTSGYGRPQEVQDKGDIYLGSMNTAVYGSIESYVRTALDILRKVGVELEDA